MRTFEHLGPARVAVPALQLSLKLRKVTTDDNTTLSAGRLFHARWGRMVGMMAKSNRSFQKTIKHILVTEWDPDTKSQGGRDGPFIVSLRIIAMLEAGKGASELADHLAGIERNEGLFVRNAVCRSVADHIVLEWHKSISN